MLTCLSCRIRTSPFGRNGRPTPGRIILAASRSELTEFALSGCCPVIWGVFPFLGLPVAHIHPFFPACPTPYRRPPSSSN